MNKKKHKPLGNGVGLKPGHVSWIYSKEAVDWKKYNEYWWNLTNFNDDQILKMIQIGICSLTNENTPSKAWNSLIIDHNIRNGKDQGYILGEKISIKVNNNGSGEWEDDFSGKSHMSYANAVLIKSLVKSLVNDLGVNESDITIYDSARIFPDYFTNYCRIDFPKLEIVDRMNSEPDYKTPINWSKNFTNSKSFFPKCVSKADYLINLANLKGHFWGVTLLAKNHFGTLMNQDLMRPPEGANLHHFLINPNFGDYSPLVDLFANKILYNKTFLYMLDGLIATQTEGTNITKENAKWKQEPFNNDYTKSLFFSQDPIALESVGFDFLYNEPAIFNENYYIRNIPAIENYIHEAAQVNNPNSKTKYLDGFNQIVENLGVHEHWNNVEEKKYSKNLGKDEGIFLEKIEL